jgi:hypothetical protein
MLDQKKNLIKSLIDENIIDKDLCIIQIGNTSINESDNDYYSFLLKNNENVISFRFDDCDEEYK